MNVYRWCDFSVQSPVPLAAPLISRSPSRSRIRFYEAEPGFFKRIEKKARFSAARGTCRYRVFGDGSEYAHYAGLGKFWISPDGGRIAYRRLAAPNASFDPFLSHLQVHAFSFALLKKGIETLHATAVAFGKGAAGFLGDSGEGKSTLTAFLTSSGHPLVADDALVLLRRGGSFWAAPGMPHLRLFPGSARKLFGAAAVSKAAPLDTGKVVVPLAPSQTVPGPLPLRALYVLIRGSEKSKIRIEPAEGKEAALHVLHSAYNAAVKNKGRLARQLAFAGEVAARVPVRKLFYPRSFARLDEVRKAVVSDLEKGFPARDAEK